MKFKERNIYVEVYVENILNMKVEVFVNVVNEVLLYGVGVVFVICNVVGREFDDDC